MTPRTLHGASSLLGLLVLLGLHYDFWRGARTGLWFGWMPEEFGYRALWLAGCLAWLAHFGRCVWRTEGDA